MLRQRLSDIMLGLVLFIVCLPAFALTAFAVWLDQSETPVVREERTTRDGRRVRIFRFRTRRLTRLGSFTTPLGEFLMRWHIDEIPQLLNVVTGEISLSADGLGLIDGLARKKVFVLRD